MSFAPPPPVSMTGVSPAPMPTSRRSPRSETARSNASRRRQNTTLHSNCSRSTGPSQNKNPPHRQQARHHSSPKSRDPHQDRVRESPRRPPRTSSALPINTQPHHHNYRHQQLRCRTLVHRLHRFRSRLQVLNLHPTPSRLLRLRDSTRPHPHLRLPRPTGTIV